MPSPAHPIATFLHDLRTWPQASQERARRNAMIAATACAQRRVERQEVEAYFTSRTAASGSEHPSADAQ